MAPDRTPASDDSIRQQCSSVGSLSPILAVRLLGAPATAETQTAARAGSGRVQGSDKQPESIVLRKQTDPAGGARGWGDGDVRTDEQPAGGEGSNRGCPSKQRIKEKQP